MKRQEILDLIYGLAHSTGLYGRLWNDLCQMDIEERDALLNSWEEMNFAGDLEFIRYYEEGVMPSGYQRPELTDEEIKGVVAVSICDMIDNNIVRGYGVESLRGWVEDGDAFANIGLTDSEIERAMKLVEQLEEAIDTINQVLGDA